MNNIYGQPNNYCCHENNYTRPTQTLPAQYNDNRCNQKCGTVFRINIPAGAEINVLNIVELSAPTGICLILRLPFLGGECGHDHRC